MPGRPRRRFHLERAISDAGFASHRDFARAIGFTDSSVSKWLDCKTDPCADARAAIASVLELSPGADCDEVRESDLDWLLEPCDELACLERMLEQCDELNR